MQLNIDPPANPLAITTKIAEYSTTAAALGELRGKYEKVIFPVATTAGMKDAIAARAELRNLRVGLEKMRVQIKAPALQRCKDIDQEAKDITSKLTALEDPIDAQIKEHEAKLAAEKAERERVEAARVAAIRVKIEAIRNIPLGMAGEDSETIATEKQALEQFDTSADFAELTDEANSAVLSAIRALNDLYHAAKAREDEAARQAQIAEENRLAALEVERQRAELAEQQAEAARIAAAQQAEAARIAAEQQTERDRIAAAELAERERVAKETKRQLDAQQAQIAADRKAAEEAQAAERAAFEAEKAEFAQQKAAAAAQAEAYRVAAMPVETVVAALDGADDDKHISLLAETITDEPEPAISFDLAAAPDVSVVALVKDGNLVDPHATGDEWAWSFNELEYSGSEPTMAEAIAHALGEAANEEGIEQFWIGKCVRFAGEGDADSVIERLQERCYDDCGEFGETYLEDVTQAEKDELEAFITAWAKRVDRSNFYTVPQSSVFTLEKARALLGFNKAAA